jgi:hypothetical protein
MVELTRQIETNINDLFTVVLNNSMIVTLLISYVIDEDNMHYTNHNSRILSRVMKGLWKYLLVVNQTLRSNQVIVTE